MDESAFSTIKVSKRFKRRLHSLKAAITARRKRRVTDEEVLAEAVAEMHRSKTKANTRRGHRRDSRFPSVWELAGFIKGGKRFSSAKETDKIVYGV